MSITCAKLKNREVCFSKILDYSWKATDYQRPVQYYFCGIYMHHAIGYSVSKINKKF